MVLFGFVGAVVSATWIYHLSASDAARAVAAVQDDRRCTTCGYFLIGLTSARCPECGTPFDPAKLRATATHANTRDRVEDGT